MTRQDDSRGAVGLASARNDTQTTAPDFTDRAEEIASLHGYLRQTKAIAKLAQDAYALGQAAGREEAAGVADRQAASDEEQRLKHLRDDDSCCFLWARQTADGIAKAIRALPLSGVSSWALATTARPSISTEE